VFFLRVDSGQMLKLVRLSKPVDLVALLSQMQTTSCNTSGIAGQGVSNAAPSDVFMRLQNRQKSRTETIRTCWGWLYITHSNTGFFNKY
jgi:predicted small secreted protein